MPFVTLRPRTPPASTRPDFTYDSRLGSTAYDWLASVPRQPDVDARTRTRSRSAATSSTCRTTRRAAATGRATSRSATTPATRSTRTSRSRTPSLGVFSQYTETDKYRLTQNRQWWSEWYVQDTWQVDAAADVRLRRAVPAGTRRTTGPTTRSRTSIRRDTTRARRRGSTSPATGQRRARRPSIRSTGQTLNPIYIGAFVPGTGNDANGMVLQTDAGVPSGFREIARAAARAAARASRGISPAPARRCCTRAPASSTRRGSAADRSGNLAANPPFIHNPIVFYGTLEQRCSRRASRSANRPAPSKRSRPTTRRRARINWSIGLRREIGLGHGGRRDLHRLRRAQHGDVLRPERVPDGARYLILHPENRDPTARSADGARCRPSSCGRTAATRTSASAATSATADYHALQVQVNRRYIHGVQFGAAYTLQRARGHRRRGSGQPVDLAQPPGRLLLLASWRRATATAWSSTTRGTSRRAITPAPMRVARSTAGSSRARTTSSPATGRTSSSRRPTTSTSPAATAGNGGVPRRAAIPARTWCGRCSSAIRWPAAAIR